MQGKTSGDRTHHTRHPVPRTAGSRAGRHTGGMIFIAVKFTVKPEWSERWIEHVTPFTEATRAEPGNLWFDWSRSVEDPNVFVLLEAFADGDAGSEHVQSEHFAQAMRDLPPALVRTPQIISEQIEATDWNLMGEMTVE